jgi:hypothetical protein
MKADAIELLNRDSRLSYVMGTTLLELMKRIGFTQNMTSEGEMILHTEIYAVSEQGVFRVE